MKLQVSDQDCLQWKWSNHLAFSVKTANLKWENPKLKLKILIYYLCGKTFALQIKGGIVCLDGCPELHSTSKFVLVWWGIVANDLEPCPQSNSERETRNHLLLLCRVSCGIWSAVMNWWGVEWVSLFQHLMALLQVWNGNNFKNLERLCWQACFYAVVWSI